MSWLVLDNSSSGATRNSGTNGDLTTLLDWALPQASWAIEYSSGNSRIYRPASGNRFRLYVDHDSAKSGAAQRCLVRGCEGATGATTFTDAFPLSSQVADASSNWLVSTLASTTDRPFIIYLSETFVYYFSQVAGASDSWGLGFFGDVPASYDSDSYNTVCSIRNSTSNTAVTSNGIGQPTSGNGVQGSSATHTYWVRDITGATKSSRGNLSCSGVSLGNTSVVDGARGGYLNKIYREKVGVTDYASTTSVSSTLALVKRGWMPNLWNPLHSGRGTVSDVDTFEDTAYNPAASFRLLAADVAAGNPCCIMEETDTWAAP